MSKSPLLNGLLLAGLLLSPMAFAADGDADALALSQHWQHAIGTTIGIAGCTITSATAASMQCLAKSKHGGTTSFTLDPAGIAPADLERALRDCSFYVGYRLCRVRVEGEVVSDEGELKVLVESVHWNLVTTD